MSIRDACITPCTIPLNLAVAVNGHLDYALVEAQVGLGVQEENCGGGPEWGGVIEKVGLRNGLGLGFRV